MRRISVWAEVTYTGNEQPGDIQKALSEIVKGSAVEVISIIDAEKYITGGNDSDDFGGKTLGDIEPLKMFQLLMKSKNTPEDRRPKMEELYEKVLHEILAEGK